MFLLADFHFGVEVGKLCAILKTFEMKKILLVVFSLLTLSGYAKELKLDMKARLSGRFLFDGISYFNAADTLDSQLNIGDLRLCGQVEVGKEWFFTVDVAMTRNKLSIKDCFAQFIRNGHSLKIGHFFGSFGIDQSMGSCDFVFHTGANSVESMYANRRMGAAYLRIHPKYFLSWGVFFSDSFINKEKTQYGYNTSLRGVWRPINTPDKLIHVGASALFKVPDMNKDTKQRTVSFGGGGVTYLPMPKFQSVVMDNVRNVIGVGCEFYVFNNRWMAQGEYNAMLVNQFHRKQFRSHGGYIQAGYLIKGRHYGYSQNTAVTLMPYDKRSLLVAVRYNYSDMNTAEAGLWGGKQRDLAVGLNYYFNKYISTRLNYTYMMLDEHSQLGEMNMHILQTRFQFRF